MLQKFNWNFEGIEEPCSVHYENNYEEIELINTMTYIDDTYDDLIYRIYGCWECGSIAWKIMGKAVPGIFVPWPTSMQNIQQ